MPETEFSISDLLETTIAERSPDLCLVVDSQPTLTINEHIAPFDVSPVPTEKMNDFFRSVARLEHIQQIQSEDYVEFIYDFESIRHNSTVFGRFRVQAEADKGSVVLLKFLHLP